MKIIINKQKKRKKNTLKRDAQNLTTTDNIAKHVKFVGSIRTLRYYTLISNRHCKIIVPINNVHMMNIHCASATDTVHIHQTVFILNLLHWQITGILYNRPLWFGQNDILYFIDDMFSFCNLFYFFYIKLIIFERLVHLYKRLEH